MKVLWISALPAAVEQIAQGNDVPSKSPAVSWILAHLPPPQGVELHIATLWPGARAYREIEYQGATFHMIPCASRGRALLLFQRDTSLFRPLFKRLRPDVVHGWGTEDSFSLVARRLSPGRHVVGIQGLITEYRKRVAMPRRTMLTEFTERWTLRKARWVVAESSYSLRVAQPLCRKAHMREIEHPLRKEFLSPDVADGSNQQILFVGNIDARKGINDALDAFTSAAPADWTLHVIGSGDTRSKDILNQRTKHLNIQDRVIHQQNLSPVELAIVMRNSSVFLLPTRIDTGPTALKEALAMGLWPVCYDNSGPGEYIRNFEFGSLAADLDSKDLHKQLSEALRMRPWLDPIRRNQVLRRARDRFTREPIWEKLMNLYAEIIAAAKNST